MTALDIRDMPRRDAEPLSEGGLREATIGAECGEVHGYFSHFARNKASVDPRTLIKAGSDGASHSARMPRKTSKKAANHLRAWREFRRMSQAQLAEKVGTADNVISLLESGQRQLSDKWLRRLAPALGTTPGFLLDHDPEDLSTDILDIWSSVPAERRDQAIAVLRTFVKTGTHD